MQKISSYLYPNRISITTDLAVHPVEWRIVYQRKFKIYKGLTNTLLLDIKNAEQKRIDVSDKDIKCVIMDELDQEIYTADAVHSGTPGLATVTIPPDAVEDIVPQFLKYTIYYLNDDMTKSPIYGDTQFGVTGTFDLLGRAVPKALEEKVIDTFIYMDDDSTPAPYLRRYYSEGVEMYQPNWGVTLNPSVNFDFEFNNLDGTVEVQFTKSPVISTAVTWTTIESFDVTNTTSTTTKTYTSEYTNDYVWARIKYTPVLNTTGKIDKVTVRI